MGCSGLKLSVTLWSSVSAAWIGQMKPNTTTGRVSFARIVGGTVPRQEPSSGGRVWGACPNLKIPFSGCERAIAARARRSQRDLTKRRLHVLGQLGSLARLSGGTRGSWVLKARLVPLGCPWSRLQLVSGSGWGSFHNWPAALVSQATHSPTTKLGLWWTRCTPAERLRPTPELSESPFRAPVPTLRIPSEPTPIFASSALPEIQALH